MKNPTAFKNPDKMSSSFFYKGSSDGGGVHTNSGVNNKAAYLMTDGGSFGGKVITGLDVMEGFYTGYGSMPPEGEGPDPGKIASQGNAYLESQFPRLDFIQKATIQ
jgi:hypothetical protein